MNDDSSVNSQISDSVNQITVALTGQAPPQSMGMLDAVLTETLGMSLHNAVARQQNAHMTSSAAVTAACAKMLQVPFSILPPPPPPPPPPAILPLQPPMDPSAEIAAAYVTAQNAIEILERAKQEAASDAQNAGDDLDKLSKEAGASASSGQNGNGQNGNGQNGNDTSGTSGNT